MCADAIVVRCVIVVVGGNVDDECAAIVCVVTLQWRRQNWPYNLLLLLPLGSKIRSPTLLRSIVHDCRADCAPLYLPRASARPLNHLARARAIMQPTVHNIILLPTALLLLLLLLGPHLARDSNLFESGSACFDYGQRNYRQLDSSRLYIGRACSGPADYDRVI